MECKCGKQLNKLYKYNKTKTGLCRACFNASGANISKVKKAYVEQWLLTGTIPSKSKPRAIIREYLFDQQEGKCVLCGQTTVWNGKELKFVLDHINGDSTEHQRSNLRLVCPNCDSQLPTFKRKNQGKGRKYDREYYHKIKGRLDSGE
jgi:protein-arginine kinase activator protein McsA